MSSTATRFEKLLEAVPDALVGMDQDGMIRFVNRQTESLFGYDRDELIGQPVDALVPEPLWQIYTEHRDDYFADPRTRSSGLDLELSGRKRDGTEFPINVSMSHIDTGDVMLVITAAADLSRRSEAVKAAQLKAAIVEHSDDAIIGSTLGGVITSWNPGAERMYGYTSREVIGRFGAFLVPDDHRDQMYAALSRINDGQSVKHLETNRLRIDGSLMPVSINVAPIRDDDGEIVGVSAVHRDVTEQRRTFEIAQRMAAIVASSDDAIIGKTLEGIVTSWNPAAEKMYGYSGEEIIGQSISLLIPVDRRGEMEAILARIRKGQHVERIETIRVRKDGRQFPASITSSPIYAAGGGVVGASLIVRDVTEQRRAFETAQRMKAIIEGSDEAIIGQTLEGIITSWNPAAEKVYGYSSEEIFGQPISLLIPEDRSGEMDDILARIRAGEQVGHLQTKRLRKNGTAFLLSVTLSPVRDEDGVVVGVAGIGRDLTEQEHAARYARSLIEADLNPLVTISPEGRINDVNEATVKITGVAREALIGSDYSQYVTESDKAHEFFEQVFEQGSATDVPMTVRHRDGTLIDFRANASVYRDINGRVLGVLATWHDVTKQSEAFEAAQRLAAIVDYSTDAIIGKTLDGIITSWNPAAEKLYGYNSEEIIGQPIEILSPRDRLSEVASILATVSAGQPVEKFETMGVRNDETVFRVSLTVVPIRDANGSVVSLSTIARDMIEHQ